MRVEYVAERWLAFYLLTDTLKEIGIGVNMMLPFEPNRVSRTMRVRKTVKTRIRSVSAGHDDNFDLEVTFIDPEFDAVVARVFLDNEVALQCSQARILIDEIRAIIRHGNAKETIDELLADEYGHVQDSYEIDITDLDDQLDKVRNMPPRPLIRNSLIKVSPFAGNTKPGNRTILGNSFKDDRDSFRGFKK